MRIKTKGFTLVELLIVIAVLGVLVATVVTVINPAKRIKQANDAKIKNDIGQLASAMQAYYTFNLSYPTEFSTLGQSESGDLKNIPTAPTGSSYNVSNTPNGCTTALKTCTDVLIYAALLDPTTGLGTWCWKSTTQTATEVAACTLP